MGQTVTNTDDGAILATEAMLETLSHLAIGSGAENTPASARASATALDQEFARIRYLQRSFVVADPGGNVQAPGGPYLVLPEPTSLAYFLFRFAALEGLGSWTEMALCGGDIAYLQRGAVITDGAQGGDDRANVDVVAGGLYTAGDSQLITVVVSQGGGSGVAEIDWTATGSEPGQTGVAVTFGTPIAIGTTGISLTFSGGVDGVLSSGDQWLITATTESASPDYATGGVFHPILNPQGQVLRGGRIFRRYHFTPAVTKGEGILDVRLIVPVQR